jgi:hypothetical protein
MEHVLALAGANKPGARITRRARKAEGLRLVLVERSVDYSTRMMGEGMRSCQAPMRAGF